ncbi:MAG: ABC transporter permease [Candidatus Eremiobacteraeota bacterium]|nr:ABC transporter permease [Candidatus Eremiobacteraeota bacterium]MBC5802617.1 ABC transporter permease [Candidatus Eremiobacteraeota bacterium]MBC5820641.1 ABC transporter permease [Candidatus Eremiobacteraeota bacterium]
MSDLLLHVRDHLILSGAALACALVLGIPLGSAIARTAALRDVSLAGVNVARVIPSLAVLALAQPFLGIGFRPSLVALVFLAIPPIVINTDVALRNVSAALIDAAHGLGMTERQVRARVAWPLALPVVFGGVRTAAVEVIASATLAAFIGGGGLGEYILNGLAGGDYGQLFEGAIAVAVLALVVQGLLTVVERRIAVRTGARSG